MAHAIVLADGTKMDLIDAPVSGDVSITADSVSSIPSGTITTDMLATALQQILFPIAVVGQAKVGYCQVA